MGPDHAVTQHPTQWGLSVCERRSYLEKNVLLDVSLFEETADGRGGFCSWLSSLCLKPDLGGIEELGTGVGLPEGILPWVPFG